MSTRQHRRAVIAFSLAGLLAACAVAVTPARADDEAPEDVLEEAVEALEDRVKEHDGDRDVGPETLIADLEDVVGLYERVEATEGLRDRDREKLLADLVDIAGDLARSRDERVAVAGIQTLGRLGHEDGARYIKRKLRPVDDALDAETEAAIVAAGGIADDGTVRYLLAIVDDSDNLKAAELALRALAHFSHSRRYRARILEEVCDSIRRSRPGRATRGGESRANPGTYIPPKSGTSGGSRWASLSRPMVEVLNELTGQRLATAEDWFRICSENKRNLDALFRDDDA